MQQLIRTGLFLAAFMMQYELTVSTSRSVEEIPKCNICTFAGSNLRHDFIPSMTRSATRFALNSAFDKTLVSIEYTAMTCSEWNDRSANGSLLIADPAVCLDLRDWLSWQCCERMPALHECETTIEEKLLSDDAKYKRNNVPLTGQAALDVTMSVHVTDIHIVNYGVDGGAVETSGSLQLEWIDERLKWNSTEAGCTSISVDESEIWVPRLIRNNEEEDEETPDTLEMSEISVLADGRSLWTGKFRMLAGCEYDGESVSKVCRINFLDNEDIGRVRYITDSVGEAISYDTGVSIPEYWLGRKKTKILMDTSWMRHSAVQNVQLQFFFRPKDENCDICGRNGQLYNGTIRHQSDRWKKLYPGMEGYNCFEIDDLLSSLSVDSKECIIGRRNFEEPCCDDTLSSYECESDIHDRTVDDDSTTTPPDPSANENDERVQTKDLVDVAISLDVIQMVEIEVKSNTLKMLVNLELSWFDQRLEWQPFIGGCYRVTYRASVDAELTEIWVPNIELANMIEGLQDLPESHASVYSNGRVVWRRTGVLTSTCELEGISRFPFDTISCYFDFGEDRDPHFHRVHYYYDGDVQFYSSLEDDTWNYQEYRLLPEQTEITTRTERLSGFENRLIRYRFYFDRASHFYVHMFVVTYMLFTYLAFGMFFIDITVGERLGYGTSILFVIVAQDITMSDSTPVTQEFLWIYKLSLGSKVFVIFGIVETLIVQWALNKHYEDSNKEQYAEEENINRRAFEVSDNNSGSDISGINNGIIEEQSRSAVSNKRTSSVTDNDEKSEDKTSSASFKLLDIPARAIKKGTKAYYRFGNKLLSLEVFESDSRSVKMKKRIKMADMTSALICITAYSLFSVILFVTGN